MPDISFESFNPRSFEQFAQALAAGVMGAGTFIFGDGPDGGREAEFQGKIHYPGTGRKWTGRTAMQAKFRQRPGDRDAEWLISQLGEDAAMMTARDSAPDYYIVATNVRLSGVISDKRKGGQQKLDEFFEANLKPIGVKAMHVWHEEKIATLLDAQPDLLRSYRAFLSPREALGVLFDQITDQIPKFGHAMFRMLQRELREQRPAKLSQAGHMDDVPVPLDGVFVDLPYAVEDTNQSPGRAIRDTELSEHRSGLLLRDLLSSTAMKLDPASRDPMVVGEHHNRFLVLGGPGQGKSTIGQFLAQIARVRLLQSRPLSELTPETRTVLPDIVARLEALNVPIEGAPRYPITVDLPTFADHLAKAAAEGDSFSLLDFLAQQIRRAATLDRLDLGVLRRWLAEFPWLLVLDGLDEVPPSANRRELLVAIAEFWDEVSSAKADLAMVISSRPQGYNDDLDPRLYQKLEMTRLTPDQALECAQKLADATITGVDHEMVMTRMRDAAANSSTKLLLISPLQVAIMLQIAGQRVPSSNRWELFDDYRDVIVKRELSKRGKVSETLLKHKGVIDLVLRRAGLLLHLEAERRGGSESYLTPARLEQIARDVLVEDEVEGVELATGPAEIVSLATQRLVLLEQRVEGRIAFEVRSLQEYLAAAELMGGTDSDVGERIQEIAGKNHWSHVFRIAASKTFANSDARKYRDSVITAIEAVNSDPAAAATQRASRIAVDLILDGVAQQHPKYLKILLAAAFKQFKLGFQSVESRLSDVLWTIDPPHREMIKPFLVSDNPSEKQAAWAILLRATRRENDWADDLAAEMWPRDVNEALGFAAVEFPTETQIGAKLASQLDGATISQLLELDGQHGAPTHRLPIPTLEEAFNSDRATFVVAKQLGQSARLRVLTLKGAERIFAGSFTQPTLSGLRPLAAFVSAPDPVGLGDILDTWCDPELLKAHNAVDSPWPISTMLAMVKGGADPAELAAAARAGEFGQAVDWLAAESRWSKNGITVADLATCASGKYFGREVASVGMPAPTRLSWDSQRANNQLWLRAIVDAAEAAAGSTRATMAWFASVALARQPLNPPMKGSRFAAVLNASVHWLDVRALYACDAEDLDGPDVKAFLTSRHRFVHQSDSEDLPFDPSLMDGLLRMSCDPDLAEVTLHLVSGDRRLARAFAESEMLVGVPFSDDANGMALGYLRRLKDADHVASALAIDPDADAAQHFLISGSPNSEARPAEQREILTIMVNGGLKVKSRPLAISRLTTMLDSDSSRLSEPAVWESLRLPPALLKMVQALA
jgi:hypothetical protein